jgi:undecaprenyl-diphosphatase
MSYLQAVILGFVQGASEWLPISSTAHMSIVRALFGWRFDPIMFTVFKAVIQWGTVLAAIVYFWKDIHAILFTQAGANADTSVNRNLLIPIIAGTIPISIAGLLLQKHIEKWEDNLHVMAFALIFFALLLWLADKRFIAGRDIRTISVMDGFLVGLGQMFALVPGASRSGSSMIAAFGIGLERYSAAKFSFLLGLPAVFLAGLHELVKYRHEIVQSHLVGSMIIATVVSFIVGYASIDWFLKYLRNNSTAIFVVYRIALGIVILVNFIYFARR